MLCCTSAAQGEEDSPEADERGRYDSSASSQRDDDDPDWRGHERSSRSSSRPKRQVQARSKSSGAPSRYAQSSEMPEYSAEEQERPVYAQYAPYVTTGMGTEFAQQQYGLPAAPPAAPPAPQPPPKPTKVSLRIRSLSGLLSAPSGGVSDGGASNAAASAAPAQLQTSASMQMPASTQVTLPMPPPLVGVDTGPGSSWAVQQMEQILQQLEPLPSLAAAAPAGLPMQGPGPTQVQAQAPRRASTGAAPVQPAAPAQGTNPVMPGLPSLPTIKTEQQAAATVSAAAPFLSPLKQFKLGGSLGALAAANILGSPLGLAGAFAMDDEHMESELKHILSDLTPGCQTPTVPTQAPWVAAAAATAVGPAAAAGAGAGPAPAAGAAAEGATQVMPTPQSWAPLFPAGAGSTPETGSDSIQRLVRPHDLSAAAARHGDPFADIPGSAPRPLRLNLDDAVGPNSGNRTNSTTCLAPPSTSTAVAAKPDPPQVKQEDPWASQPLPASPPAYKPVGSGSTGTPSMSMLPLPMGYMGAAPPACSAPGACVSSQVPHLQQHTQAQVAHSLQPFTSPPPTCRLPLAAPPSWNKAPVSAGLFQKRSTSEQQQQQQRTQQQQAQALHAQLLSSLQLLPLQHQGLGGLPGGHPQYQYHEQQLPQYHEQERATGCGSRKRSHSMAALSEDASCTTRATRQRASSLGGSSDVQQPLLGWGPSMQPSQSTGGGPPGCPSGTGSPPFCHVFEDPDFDVNASHVKGPAAGSQAPPQYHYAQQRQQQQQAVQAYGYQSARPGQAGQVPAHQQHGMHGLLGLQDMGQGSPELPLFPVPRMLAEQYGSRHGQYSGMPNGMPYM